MDRVIMAAEEASLVAKHMFCMKMVRGSMPSWCRLLEALQHGARDPKELVSSQRRQSQL